VRLARARGAVQQEAALEVLTRRDERGGSLPDADNVALDTVEHAVREYHLLGGKRQPRQEAQRAVAAVLAVPERQHLAR
jgi:hypothetical protein